MSSNIFWGIILVVLGVLFLVDHAGVIDIDIGDLWPLILVYVGLHMLLKARSKRLKEDVSTEGRE